MNLSYIHHKMKQQIDLQHSQNHPFAGRCNSTNRCSPSCFLRDCFLEPFRFLRRDVVEASCSFCCAVLDLFGLYLPFTLPYTFFTSFFVTSSASSSPPFEPEPLRCPVAASISASFAARNARSVEDKRLSPKGPFNGFISSLDAEENSAVVNIKCNAC